MPLLTVKRGAEFFLSSNLQRPSEFVFVLSEPSVISASGTGLQSERSVTRTTALCGPAVISIPSPVLCTQVNSSRTRWSSAVSSGSPTQTTRLPSPSLRYSERSIGVLTSSSGFCPTGISNSANRTPGMTVVVDWSDMKKRSRDNLRKTAQSFGSTRFTRSFSRFTFVVKRGKTAGSPACITVKASNPWSNILGARPVFISN